ncbi:MAG: AMP-binding protein [Oceanospirillaceae bacterium]|nr:AMP-binding protein [Oceanospirillaceae bacterium]
MQSSTASYTQGDTAQSLLKMTLGDALDHTVALYPDNPALIAPAQNIRYNYREFQAKVNLVARAFIAIGVTKGERVGIWAPNCEQWVVTQFATAKMGAILVNVNPAYQEYELEYALKHSGVSCLVMAEKFKSSDYCQTLMKIVPELSDSAVGHLKSVKLPLLRRVINLSKHDFKGMQRWDDFCELAVDVTQSQLDVIQRQLDYNDAINIQYTSGTTGSPKGVTLSHFNILNNGYFVAKNMNFSHLDRLIIPVPLYHCFGMVMGNIGCVSHGATMIYPSASFDAQTVLQCVEAEKATALYSVPTMFIAMLALENFNDYDLSSLRTGIMAGSICPAQLMKAVNTKMHMGELQIAYGMTETSPVSAQTAADDPFDKKVSTVGRTLAHIETKIVDVVSGGTVPRNETGELCTRGYSVMLGYWQNEAASKEIIETNGWLHSGDLARMDEEGYIQIVGRIKDMVIRSGENIYPKEIEDFLYTHPAISDAQVTGIPDELRGEELVAWIILRPDAAPMTAEQLREFCRGKISHFKIPRYIKFVDRYPLTVTGKVQKFKIREMAIEEFT